MMETEKQWSNTKHTLVTLLQQEIDDLQPSVVEMKQNALVKQVAKRKVLYNLTRKGQLQLVYALLALAQSYLSKNLVESAIRTLHEARTIRTIGDAGYLLGSALIKKNEKQEAIHWLQTCFEEEWIQPSLEHKNAAKLQAMTFLQQLYFQTSQRQKLLEISYKKIEQAKASSTQNEKQFHALSLLDLANIHEALGQFILAHQKIDGAILIYETQFDQPLKLIDAYIKKGQMQTKIGQANLAPLSYNKAHQVIKRYPGCVNEDKQASILEAYIESYILA